MTKLKYRPEIDGLRGIAILAVLVNHVDSKLLPGGYVGVDVFFVISGYLITSVLRRDLEDGAFSFTSFYARRARRLVPAATAMVAGVVLLAAPYFLPVDFKDLGASVVANATMMANVLFWKWDDYFGGQDRAWPLLHTWSLAVEEQFYLAYPLLLWATRSWRRSALVWCLGTLALISFGLSVYQSVYDARSAYFLLPSRAWELLVGALAASIPSVRVSTRATELLGWAAALAIGLPMLTLDETSFFPGWAAVPPVVGTALMIMVCGAPHAPWNTRLRLPGILFFGTISYSLYLWHWPLLVLARYPWSPNPALTPTFVPWLAASLSIAIAALSFRYVESPFRRSFQRPWLSLTVAAGCMAFLVCVGLIIHRTKGLPARLPETVVAYSHAAMDCNPRRPDSIDKSARDIRRGEVGLVGCGDGPVSPRFVFWGDSHADALAPLAECLARETGRCGVVLTKGATPPLIETSFGETGRRRFADPEHIRAAADYIQSKRIPDVVLIARWSGYVDRCSSTRPGDVPNDSAGLTSALRRTLRFLQQHGAQRVWLVAEIPEQPFDVPRRLALDALFGKGLSKGTTPEKHHDRVAAANRSLLECVSENVSVIDLSDIFFRVHDGLLTPDGKPFYSDHSHVTASGAPWLQRAFIPFVDSLKAMP